MAHVPSTKGASFLHTWEELQSLIERELISRDELEVRLDVEALAILDEKVEPDLEYALDAVDQLARLVVEIREREQHRAREEPVSWPDSTASRAEIIREYRPEQDQPALSDLWSHVFGVTKGGQTVDWIFRSGPAGEAVRTVIEVGGRIVAHAGVAPVRFMLGDRVVRGAYSVGAMTDPAVRGRGYFVRIGRYLYRRLEEEGFAFVAGFSNRNSCHLMTGPLGRSSVRPFPWSVRVLKPVSLVRSALGCSRAQAPPPAATFVAREEDGVEVSLAEPDDPRIDTVWSRARPGVALGGIRDAAFSHWRFATRPDAGYRLLLAERAGVPAAYVVSRPLKLRGISALFLVDFVLADGEDNAGMVLLRALTGVAREEGAEIMSALLPGSGPARRVLRKTGFRRVPGPLHPRLIRFSVRGLGRYAGHPTLVDPGSWSLSWAATDVV
jgi:GNAT superfamily N-acetyltransferase